MRSHPKAQKGVIGGDRRTDHGCHGPIHCFLGPQSSKPTSLLVDFEIDLQCPWTPSNDCRVFTACTPLLKALKPSRQLHSRDETRASRSESPNAVVLRLTSASSPLFSPTARCKRQVGKRLEGAEFGISCISFTESCSPFEVMACCNCAAAKKSGASETESASDFKVQVFSSSTELLEKLHEKWNSVERKPYPAMYSSIFGGIILDPALMVIPIDDHMVHRGHGVFDTAIILDGYLYELDVHLDRFVGSASKAKISPPFPKSTLRSILIQLSAASQCKKGTLRYWLSAGPGDFLLSPAGCPTSAFYAVVIDEDFSQCKEGVRVITSTIPMKSPLFATMKNVNYLPNVLSKMEAEEQGAFASIWVGDDGYIAEGPNVNVAFITHEKELVLPTFDKILHGCTAKRLLQLAPKLVEQGLLKSVKTANLTVEEAKGAAEMMYVGSTLPLLPIIAWDDQPIGDGKVGELTMALSDLVWEDMVAGPETQRLRIPYA